MSDTCRLVDLIGEYRELLKEKLDTENKQLKIGSHFNFDTLRLDTIKDLFDKLAPQKGDKSELDPQKGKDPILDATLRLWYSSKSKLLKDFYKDKKDLKRLLHSVSNKVRLFVMLANDNKEIKEEIITNFGKALYKLIEVDRSDENKNVASYYFNNIYPKREGLKTDLGTNVNPNAAIRELYHSLHPDEIPLINGCATDAISYIFEIEKDSEYSIEVTQK